MATSSVAVLSDAHLGDSDSLLELTVIQEAVIRAVAERSPGTLVLLGDTMDLDFGTLVTGIEGRFRHADRAGLRALLVGLCRQARVSAIRYVVGNHDFVVWDWEARRQHTLRPLHDGGKITGGVMREGCLRDSFLTGLLPADSGAELTVSFPHYVTTVGGAVIVFTHGHYLERQQCGFMSLADIARLPESKHEDFLDRLFKASAQYQIVVEGMATRREWRRQSHRIYSVVTAPLDRLNAWWASRTGMRDKPLSPKWVPAIEAYLQHVVRGVAASAFIFGHTHIPGRGDKPVPVYNSGSFVPPADRKASMLFLSPVQDGAEVEMVEFSATGATEKKPYGVIPGLAQPVAPPPA